MFLQEIDMAVERDAALSREPKAGQSHFWLRYYRCKRFS